MNILLFLLAFALSITAVGFMASVYEPTWQGIVGIFLMYFAGSVAVIALQKRG